MGTIKGMDAMMSVHCEGCMCNMCNPPNPGYTSGKNYEMESNRPVLRDDSFLENASTTNDPLKSGVIIRQPI